MGTTFEWPVRVYYEDTDAAGIVYHANYLRFMERARTEWLRDLGFEQDVLRQQQGLVFVIVRSDIRYQRAVRFNEELMVNSRIQRLRGASIEFVQEIFRNGDERVCEGLNIVGCVNADSMNPQRIPKQMLKVFSRAQ